MSALPESLRIIVGLFVLLFVLAATGWFLWRCLRKSVDGTALLVRWIATAVILGLAGVFLYDITKDGTAAGQIVAVLAGGVLGLILAVLWLPTIVSRVAEAIGSLYTGGSEPPTPTPAYSVAEARRKQGRLQEAVYEIQQQLAKFPTDVTGQLMLAEVQAESLGDLRSAENTILRLVAQEHAPKNIAFALNSLADWRLKLARDPDAARQALERIGELLPDTPEAQNAAQRIAHLPSSAELQRRDEAAPVIMAVGQRDLGLRSDVRIGPKDAEDPEQTAARLEAHLSEHPLDREVREKLALLYADEFQRFDAALEQFESLAQLPNQTPRDVAKWINRVADIQILQGASEDSIRATLQRIVDLFPGLAPAELARQRLGKVRLEIKGKENSQSVHLGTYERDLGLKKFGSFGSCGQPPNTEDANAKTKDAKERPG